MTEADDLLAHLSVEDAEASKTPNENGWIVSVVRYYEGQRYRHSLRLDLTPTEEQLQNARDTFSFWWAETTRDGLATEAHQPVPGSTRGSDYGDAG